MKLACPHCRGNIEFGEEWLGHEVSCPHCEQVFQIQFEAPSVEPAVNEAQSPISDEEPDPGTNKKLLWMVGGVVGIVVVIGGLLAGGLPLFNSPSDGNEGALAGYLDWDPGGDPLPEEGADRSEFDISLASLAEFAEEYQRSCRRLLNAFPDGRELDSSKSKMLETDVFRKSLAVDEALSEFVSNYESLCTDGLTKAIERYRGRLWKPGSNPAQQVKEIDVLLSALRTVAPQIQNPYWESQEEYAALTKSAPLIAPPPAFAEQLVIGGGRVEYGSGSKVGGYHAARRYDINVYYDLDQVVRRLWVSLYFHQKEEKFLESPDLNCLGITVGGGTVSGNLWTVFESEEVDGTDFDSPRFQKSVTSVAADALAILKKATEWKEKLDEEGADNLPETVEKIIHLDEGYQSYEFSGAPKEGLYFISRETLFEGSAAADNGSISSHEWDAAIEILENIEWMKSVVFRNLAAYRGFQLARNTEGESSSDSRTPDSRVDSLLKD